MSILAVSCDDARRLIPSAGEDASEEKGESREASQKQCAKTSSRADFTNVSSVILWNPWPGVGAAGGRDPVARVVRLAQPGAEGDRDLDDAVRTGRSW
jgi:hypothetical protein